VKSEHDREKQAGEGDDPGAAEGLNVPAWALALRGLYQQVVEEPLPEALASLIARLDGEGP